MEFSTINLGALRKLRRYTLPPTYSLGRPGHGCLGDPPGFPSYFTRSVYTKYGASPYRGPFYVIEHEGSIHVVTEKWSEDIEARLRKLWLPLPLDHPRTRLWILSSYRSLHHCYNGYGDDMVIWPVPSSQHHYFKDDPRWNDAYRTAKAAEVEAFNQQLEDQAARLATPENHNAVRKIRKFYPDYQPELDLIENQPGNQPQWWGTEATQPTPETCARTQTHWNQHPINGTWCQWCGWKEEGARGAR